MRCHWKISQPNRVITNPGIWIDSFVYVGHHSPNMTSNWHPHNGYWCTSHTLSRIKKTKKLTEYSKIKSLFISNILGCQYLFIFRKHVCPISKVSSNVCRVSWNVSYSFNIRIFLQYVRFVIQRPIGIVGRIKYIVVRC